MARTITFGLAALLLAFFVRTTAQAQASAQEVTARDADGKRPATLAEINALLSDLADVSAELDAAQAMVDHSADAEWRWDECRFQSLNDPLWTAREESLTARCAVGKWPVPGGLSEFSSIAACESGWNRFANNAGRYLGLFQHAASAYVSRIHAYSPAAWARGLSERWTNSRGQIVMSARMMHANGTGAWSCA